MGLRHSHLTPPFDRERAMPLVVPLLNVLLLTYVLSDAQSVCGNTRTTLIRVENTTGLETLRAALNCTGGGGGGDIEVSWAGRVTVNAPIAIAQGTFLSVAGDDIQAEVHGDESLAKGTRLFEVYQGGGLSLTKLKLSGGYAPAGGAIFSLAATLTLDNCVFEGNSATDGSGGAVFADGGAFTIVGGKVLGI